MPSFLLQELLIRDVDACVHFSHELSNPFSQQLIFYYLQISVCYIYQGGSWPFVEPIDHCAIDDSWELPGSDSEIVTYR